ncbi:MAG: sugar kinase, partial [Defluviitaleaceae bacterium]|nr:sugar kinase [Defluviitaleaceae bacterium]
MNFMDNYLYDLISLGEVMLRLDPGIGRVRTARSFTAWEGGGEYNVARGLRKCFGLNTAIITALADNEVGRLVEDFIMQGGVETRYIKWRKYDGIGRVCRNGLNFTERGFGVRGALGVSDRANTAVSQLKPGDIDWGNIFSHGVRNLHTGGIFAALSETTSQLVLEACKYARQHGTFVSYDLNYRPSLWADIGGHAQAQKINKEIAASVDIMIGNEEDYGACLGFELGDLHSLNLDDYKNLAKECAKAYPNLKAIAITMRTVKTAGINDWTAILYTGGQVYIGMELNDMEILDRVGGGDSFASGLLYGLMSGCDPQTALNYGIS